MNIKQIQANFGYVLLAIFAIGVGLYPLRFIGLPYNMSLLGDKSAQLLQSNIYLLGFYFHIGFGGLALLSGFSQFFPRLRKKQLNLHRNLGKVYVSAVLLSGLAGLGIAYFASGGMVAVLGFGSLAILWLYTTIKAYTSIKAKEIIAHQNWMIRSYALCFAAVTLRIYLPLSLAVLQLEFYEAYRFIAWLCWVPNLILAEYLISKNTAKSLS